MKNIAATVEGWKQGPLTFSQSLMADWLLKHGMETPQSMMKITSLNRSSFWRDMMDMKEQNIVVFVNHPSEATEQLTVAKAPA